MINTMDRLQMCREKGAHFKGGIGSSFSMLWMMLNEKESEAMGLYHSLSLTCPALRMQGQHYSQ